MIMIMLFDQGAHVAMVLFSEALHQLGVGVWYQHCSGFSVEIITYPLLLLQVFPMYIALLKL